MPTAIHISGIRVAHVDQPERAVRVNRPGRVDGPIAWGEMGKLGGVQVRCGRGRSGLRYHVRKRPGTAASATRPGTAAEWRIGVVGARTELDIGSARMEDHALALACMWEEAVLGGRIDMS